MSNQQAFLETTSSQIPALQLLIHMGWTYLSPKQAVELRDGREKNTVLTGILRPWLSDQNKIRTKGKTVDFSAGNIDDALSKLVNEPFQSLTQTNETLYDLLTLGTTLTQTIDGDRKSYSLHYIDWKNPANNLYHVTDEYSIERRGSKRTRRPDIVLFINGIPIVIIECKRADKEKDGEPAVFQGIRQQITYQGEKEIPHLYTTSQLLLTITPNDAYYGTTNTAKKFWSVWREEEIEEEELDNRLSGLINAPVQTDVWEEIMTGREYEWQIREHFKQLGPCLPSVQDRALYALLRHERLLQLIYQFIVFDEGIKKIARYQQYFAIQQTINRVANLNAQGNRTGGVIWHTTGSGKSLTMVMLAKALALHPNIGNPRIILVTDRVNLDNQIFKTFKNCGKSVAQAKDGKQLVRLVTGKLNKNDTRADVITTIINKFEEAARQKTRDENPNIFVLVDESHRSQYGSLNAKMQKVFPNACFIGFTGTPLTKKEKSTATKFGAFIHKYPIRTAVADGAVVPLLYEGRIVEQNVDKEQLERWFERITRHLEKEEKADLKRKMSRSDVTNATDQRIQEIAYDISQHYIKQWRGTGFKGQLATASKEMGLKYLDFLSDFEIDCALAISPPDMREGADEVDAFEQPKVQAFWKKMMDRHRTEKEYNEALLRNFKDPEKTEILIVVDKLLTGFDEPRNTVLYIDKPLKEHTLLQAIARVNRLHDGKEFGYIIDYRGVLGQLNDALDLYDKLADFDPEDIDDTLIDIKEEVNKLAQQHSDLWGIFEPVSNKQDIEAMGQFLAPEDRRQRFYEALTAYASTLKLALGVVRFYEETSEERIKQYKDDLKFFHRLRQATKLRYAEAVDFRDYEDKVRKLLNDYVKATGTSQITPIVNIFDTEAFDEEVAKLHTPAAKADMILSHLKRSITEKMDEDPILYKKYADMVEETIQAYREGRIDELEFLNRAKKDAETVRSGSATTAEPTKLTRYQDAGAYFRSMREPLVEYHIDPEIIADAAIEQEAIIESLKVTDWENNLDIEKRMKRKLDDVFYDLSRKTGIDIDLDEIDQIIDQIVDIARSRSRGS